MPQLYAMKRLVQVSASTLVCFCLFALVLVFKSSPTVFKLGCGFVCCSWMVFVLPHAVLVDLAVDSLKYKLPAAVWNTASLGQVLTAYIWSLCVCWTLLRAPTQEIEEVICLLQAPNATAWELAQNVVVISLWTARTHHEPV